MCVCVCSRLLMRIICLGPCDHRADGHAGADDPAEPGVSAAPEELLLQSPRHVDVRRHRTHLLHPHPADRGGCRS